jgi:hypothetical protein
MKLGLKPAPLDSSAEEIIIHLFLLRPGANHFAAPELQRYGSLRRARIALNQAAVVVLAAGLAWGGYNMSGAFQASQVDDQVVRQIADLTRQYEDVNREMPSFGVGGATMRDAVAFYNTRIKGFPTMPEFLRPLSAVLQARPDVRLQQVSWLATDDAKATPPLSTGTARSSGSVTATRKAETPSGVPPSPESAANPPFAGGRYEVAMIEGTVRVTANDYRGAVAGAQALADSIARIPGYTADVVESPLDTRSSLAIQGRHGERDPATMEPRFLLRVTRDRGAAA